MTRTKKLCVYSLGFLALSTGGLMKWSGWTTLRAREEARTFAPIMLPDSSDIALGKRIVTIRNGCVDCHGKDLGGASVINDPMMGQIWASNVTPAALKSWSDEEIAQAIRNGVDPQHRPLVLMPSHEYQHLSLHDLSAVVAYLRSVPPVTRANSPIVLGPMANLLFALGKLPTLIPAASLIRPGPETRLVEKPPEAPTPEFGKYLVTASCTGCHGPQLAGGPIPGGPPSWAPAADLRGLVQRNWTYATFTKAMREGKGADGHPLREPMPVGLTKQLNDTELRAMWAYLERERAG